MVTVENKPLVLRTPTWLTISVVVLVVALGLGGAAGGLALAANGWWIPASLVALADALILLGLTSQIGRRYLVDDDGVEKRSLVGGPVRIRWADIIFVYVNNSIMLTGLAKSRIPVAAGLEGFAEFLDRLEDRPEYERWLRAAVAGDAEPRIEDGVVPRQGWLATGLTISVVLWLLAVAFALRSDVFAGQHLMLQGKGALLAILFNLLFVDHPSLGIVTLSGLAFLATSYFTKGWHTLRIEPDGLQFDSILRPRWIPYEEIHAVEYKIGRAGNPGQIKPTAPVLRLILAGGVQLPLFSRKTGFRVKDLIEAAMAEHCGDPRGAAHPALASGPFARRRDG
jgi:hypothetical protein